MFPSDIRKTNIESVCVPEGILAYARVSDGRVALIIANPSAERKTVSAECAINVKDACALKARDLMSGKKYKASISDGKLRVDGIRIDSEDVAVISVKF